MYIEIVLLHIREIKSKLELHLTMRQVIEQGLHQWNNSKNNHFLSLIGVH